MPEKFTVVELEKIDTKPLGTPKELTAAVLSLRGHLGFEELLRRFRVTKAMLRAKLESEAGRGEQGDYLRALIHAYSFVERQLKQETGRPVEKPRMPLEDEQLEFNRISAALEIVGAGKGLSA
jgi:hypothetical protein